MIEVLKNEATATLRRMYFHCVDATDGMTPETGEVGGQPQISINGAAWGNATNVLVAIGNGRYYVELTQTEVNITDKSVIEGRYKSANTAEAVGTTIQVLEFIPDGKITELDDKLDLLVAGNIGANTVTITVYVYGTTTPIPEYQIDIWNSDLSVFITSVETDVLGQTTVNLDSATYKLKGRKVGYDADNEIETFIVSAVLLTKTVYATAVIPSSDWTTGEW